MYDIGLLRYRDKKSDFVAGIQFLLLTFAGNVWAEPLSCGVVEKTFSMCEPNY